MVYNFLALRHRQIEGASLNGLYVVGAGVQGVELLTGVKGERERVGGIPRYCQARY